MQLRTYSLLYGHDVSVLYGFNGVGQTSDNHIEQVEEDVENFCTGKILT